MIQPFQSFRVICEPRTAFVRAAEQGGPGLLFVLQAFELMLTHPKLWVGALLRAPGAPMVAVMTLVQAVLAQVAGPLLCLLLVATLYNMLARWHGRGADLWAVIGALSLAWLPHTVATALAVCLHRTAMAQAQAQPYAALMLLPTLYGALALRTLWQQGSISTQPQTPARPTPAASAAAYGVGVFLLLGSTATLWQVHSQWGQMRPKLAGDTMPSFELDGINTQPLASSALGGHVTLIDFWATWCGPCMKAMPELERMHRDYKAQGLKVVAVNIEANNRVGIESLIATQQLTLPIYQDTRGLAEQMHVHVYPTSFLIDAQGRIVHVYTGPADAREIEQRIVMLLERAKLPAPL